MKKSTYVFSIKRLYPAFFIMFCLMSVPCFSQTLSGASVEFVELGETKTVNGSDQSLDVTPAQATYDVEFKVSGENYYVDVDGNKIIIGARNGTVITAVTSITFNFSGGTFSSIIGASFNSGASTGTNTGDVSASFTATSVTIFGIQNKDFAQGYGLGNMGTVVFDITTAGVANTAPVIGGTTSGQNVNDNSTISPFSSITTTDADGDNLSATITLDDNAKGVLSGTGLSGSGPYTIASTTPADLQTKLRALSFNPTDNRTATSETTTFTIVVNDGTDTDTDNTTTVISSAVAPTVTNVAVPSNATYVTGQNLDFTVNFNENVTVNTTGGIPQIAITIGATTRQATYISGSGTNALVFRHTILTGDLDTDGIAVGSLAANGGTLKDAEGKDVNLTLNSVGSTAAVLVDAVPPSGYTVQIDQTDVNALNETAISFTFSAAEVGTTYNYTISSDSGGTPITGSGSIATSNQQITTIDVSSLNDGTLTVSVNLTDNAGNIGGNTTDTTIKNTAIAYTPDTNNILYVNKNVSGGSQDGSSWVNAIPELADALKWANNNQDPNWATTPLQIWVAGGTYTPLYSPRDGVFGTDQGRENAFLMVKNVQLYGGFAGTETSLANRDLGITANATVLSGDIDNNDVLISPIPNAGNPYTEASIANNTYHILMGSGDAGQAVLDGFTIRGGNANNGGNYYINGNYFYNGGGGGVYFRESNPMLKNIFVYGNHADYDGAGVLNVESSPSLLNVYINGNTASNDGGGLYNLENSNPNLTNITITGNTANHGGGIYNSQYSSLSLTNVAIVGNTANSGGGMYNDYDSSLTINNSIVWGTISNIGLPYTPNYSLIQGNTNTANGNIDATGLTAEDIFTDPANGDYSLKDGSPAINTGSNSLYTNAGGDLNNDTDLVGNPRLYNNTIDIGAFESQNAPPTAICENITIQLDTNGQISITASDVDDGSSDLEGNVTLSIDKTDFDCSNIGDNTILLTVEDSSGATATCQAIVTVKDITAPAPDNLTLTDITAECQVLATDVPIPTATDNCGETIYGTHNLTFPISAQGTHVITWTFDDGKGNADTQTQNIIINDVTAPTSNSLTLVDITAECQVLATDVPIPTATDNCGEIIYGTHNLTFPISTQGTHVITWTFDDGKGNSDTQTQNIIINDVTAPTPDNLTLADITAECQVLATDVPIPTATDNCGATIQGTHNLTFPISTQGTHVITWTFDDGKGNADTQTQNIIINDVTAPIPDNLTLADITAECQVLATDVPIPTATDNCGATIQGTHNLTFPISTQGTHVITWTFDDGKGNADTQTQNIIIDDVTAPTPDNLTLTDITAECQVLATDVPMPTATDNCGATIQGTHNLTFPINTQGTHVIIWTFDDGKGNADTQTQNIIINDVTAPTPDNLTLTDITAECQVLATDVPIPTATDNCGATIQGTHNLTFPISTQGTHVITWTFDDGNGNTDTQTQNIIIDDVTAPIPDVTNLPVIERQCAVLATDIPIPTATDNCEGSINATTTDPLTYSDQGTHTITWTFNDGNGNTSTQTQSIIVHPSPIENLSLNDLTVTYDGNLHQINVNNLPTGASVSYSTTPNTGEANGAINAGVYTVTAIVSPPANAINCEDINLTATLTIEKAPQEITFNSLPILYIEDDDDFQLTATASSGLPVDYTYTFTANNPPATVSSTGWVTLLTSGIIEITAHQAGNENYLPATPVMQPLQINSRDASIHHIAINNEVYHNPSEEIYYTIDCETEQTIVTIELTTETNATALPAHYFEIETPVPGIYKKQVQITSQDGSSVRNYTIIIEKRFSFEDIVIQKFNNVLLVNNNPSTNGGYRFIAYKWYKNNQLISNTQYYSAGNEVTDTLDPNAVYHVEVTTENGEVISSCEFQITLNNTDYSIDIYPNPVKNTPFVTIHTSFPLDDVEDGMDIQLYSLTGQKVRAYKVYTKKTRINVSDLSSGVYIIECKTKSYKKVSKVIID